MKQVAILFVLLISILLFSENELSLRQRIEKYSGKNSEGLLDILDTQEGDTLKCAKFLLENCSSNDLTVLTKDFLLNNIKYALKTKEFLYTKNYSEDIFQHFVLPYRVSQEPLEEYREQFYNELKPLVENVENIEEAAILVNLWAFEQMTFKQTNGRDQAPLTTIKRGYGRCEEMMIIYIAAARSVGIPARPASVSYWNFTDNNHAWVEIWTPDGWKYTGGAEPSNSLNNAWFSNTTQRATLITSRAFGKFESKNTIKQKDNVTTISSIEFYTDYENIQINVKDENEHPVPDAKVVLYAASYGGLFPMSELETDDNGSISIPPGKGTVYATAFKDNKFAHSLLNTMKSSSLELKLTEDKNLDENFVFLFPIPFSTTKKEEIEILGDKFKLMRENADLKRKDRLNNLKKSNEFVEYYDLVKISENIDSTYFNKRREFLDKVDELAENSSQYLKVLQKVKSDSLKTKILVNMLVEWDIKELIEIPDSTEIENVVNIYHEGKLRFQDSVPDSIFIDNVIHRIWRSAIPPENGWWLVLYEKIEHLVADDIDKTVQNVINWIDSQIEIDSNFVWTYFSGSLNPNDILNLKYIPEFYRTKLLVCCLKELGVPLQWKGRLEYYNGNGFVVVEEKEEEAEKDYEAEIMISIFVDGEQVKAEEFKNFLIAKLDDKDGSISYTFFEGENDSLDYKAKYRRQDSDNIYIESFIRNSNGDANIVIKSFGKDENHLKIELITPKEYLDLTEKWNEKTIKNIKKISLKADSKNKKILFIRGEIKNEPEERMLLKISEKIDKFKDHNSVIIVYSENRENSDLSVNQDFILKKGKKIIKENFSENEYPVIFVLDEKNEIIFSSKGYNMGIVDLLLKKVK